MQIDRPADSVSRHWSEALPGWAQPFAQLSRWDRPVGWRLLLIPCLMGLSLARANEGFLWPQDFICALAFLVGAVAMRGAGCTYNDIIDRRIDAEVERTRGRPLPAGRVSVRAAWIWLGLQALIGAGALLPLPRVAAYVALASLPLVALYPFMKRVTWWPQAWLGLCFSWGALVAGAAVDGRVSPEIGVLFLGCVAWVMAYDTIYALQDIEDDALVGVRSTARLFAGKWRTWVTAFYMLALYFWGVAAGMARAAWPAGALFFVVALLSIAVTVRRIDAARPETALAAFKANVGLGLLAALAFALNPLWIFVKPLWGL